VPQPPLKQCFIAQTAANICTCVRTGLAAGGENLFNCKKAIYYALRSAVPLPAYHIRLHVEEISLAVIPAKPQYVH
jgi:hypothetical protein